MITYKKIGGLRFLTIGRVNFSWSVTSEITILKRRRAAMIAAMFNAPSAREFEIRQRELDAFERTNGIWSV